MSIDYSMIELYIVDMWLKIKECGKTFENFKSQRIESP